MPVEDDDLYDDEHDGDGGRSPDQLRLRCTAQGQQGAQAGEARRRHVSAPWRSCGHRPGGPGMAAYFVKGYDGDLTPEKIREAAVSAESSLRPRLTRPSRRRRSVSRPRWRRSSASPGAATAGMAAPSAGEEDQIALAEAMRRGGIEALTATLAAQGIPVEEFWGDTPKAPFSAGNGAKSSSPHRVSEHLARARCPPRVTAPGGRDEYRPRAVKSEQPVRLHPRQRLHP